MLICQVNSLNKFENKLIFMLVNWYCAETCGRSVKFVNSSVF